MDIQVPKMQNKGTSICHARPCTGYVLETNMYDNNIRVQLKLFYLTFQGEKGLPDIAVFRVAECYA